MTISINDLLKTLAERKGSDLFITAGVPPSVKINGQLVPVSNEALPVDVCRELVFSSLNEAQKKELVDTKELNYAISARSVGRFRASAFYQRNTIGMVIRRIETDIPNIDKLGLPHTLKDLAMTKRGLVVFVGATGTGKSTSLASMIGHRNENSKGHIVSVEDPIEFVHQHRGCIVTQREVGIDTESFEIALKNVLRQAPDVIMIGEVRTRETMEHAITFAETGHLCLCTLHANNANQALDRILHFFPPERHQQLWMDLSLNLKGMVAQQLVPCSDGKSRKAAVEVLLNTPLASDLIRKGDVPALKELMKRSNELGMQTFDQSLFQLFKRGEISYENAIAHADSANDLRLMIKLDSDKDYSGAASTADSNVAVNGFSGQEQKMKFSIKGEENDDMRRKSGFFK